MRRFILVIVVTLLPSGTLIAADLPPATTTRPSACEVIRDCRVVRELRPHRGRSHAEFSVRDDDIYYFGVKQAFDARSFHAFQTAACQGDPQRYAVDEHDVYFPSPQSCGGSSCDAGAYTGYFWASQHVEHPESYMPMGGGYGRDAAHVYYRWEAAKVDADASTFEVLWCHARGSAEGDVVGRDRLHYFVDGKRVDRTVLERKWNVER